MFDAHDFFKKRFSGHLKEINRYLRYILNEHIVFAMLFFVAALAFYYQQWLSNLPEDFPTAWVLGLVFGIVASLSPVQTLLKEPDLVFLTPVEHLMGPYFRNSLIYSFVIQLYLVLIAAAALGPLYFHTYPERGTKMYLLIVVVLLIFKGWNLLANWWMLKIRDVSVRRIDTVARLILGIAIFYFLIDGNVLLAGVSTLLFMIVFLYDWRVSSRQAGVAWDILLEKDQMRMQAFYRLANMFTDVPHLKTRIKKRRWVARFAAKVSWGQDQTYDYLYRLTFVRSDYFWMYLRLVIIGGVAVWAVPNIWMKIIFTLLFLYLSGFQMMTLFHHHRTVMWLDLYPVRTELRSRALLRLLRKLAYLQTVLLVIAALISSSGDWLTALSVLGVGIGFNVLFNEGYVRKKMYA
ncbi:Protein EcsB [Lentibacillus sp. JNUCC-1]|uniref:ABC transporter permease n=1 Tax=Lentibacillus sp. JNUCC-1 TaxID=2654513 RepID=UPI0012E8B493|nr:ABC transporter permease [Lentibacillus sp. JNUCC-1]MUV36589.1 Protein EcsB [Lentibacillus sp. JNUCC-1]